MSCLGWNIHSPGHALSDKTSDVLLSCAADLPGLASGLWVLLCGLRNDAWEIADAARPLGCIILYSYHNNKGT